MGFVRWGCGRGEGEGRGEVSLRAMEIHELPWQVPSSSRTLAIASAANGAPPYRLTLEH